MTERTLESRRPPRGGRRTPGVRQVGHVADLPRSCRFDTSRTGRTAALAGRGSRIARRVDKGGFSLRTLE